MGTPELLKHKQCDQYNRDDDSVKNGHDAVLPQEFAQRCTNSDAVGFNNPD